MDPLWHGQLPKISTRVLLLACEQLGGARRLAASLEVPVAQLFRWLDGLEDLPKSVFLTLVDLIVEQSDTGPADPGKDAQHRRSHSSRESAGKPF